MARNVAICPLRATRASLETARAASSLIVGELYEITDENTLAWATAVNAYVDVTVKDALITLAKMANLAANTVIGRVTQSTGVPEDLSEANIKSILALTASDVGLGNVTNNAQYYSGGTDVAITDGGTGQSTAQAALNALMGTSEQGDVAYFNGTNWVVLHHGSSGQFLKSQGHAANPLWADQANDQWNLTEPALITSLASINLSTGNWFNASITSDQTFSFTNLTNLKFYTFAILNNDSSAHVITFPASTIGYVASYSLPAGKYIEIGMMYSTLLSKYFFTITNDLTAF